MQRVTGPTQGRVCPKPGGGEWRNTVRPPPPRPHSRTQDCWRRAARNSRPCSHPNLGARARAHTHSLSLSFPVTFPSASTNHKASEPKFRVGEVRLWEVQRQSRTGSLGQKRDLVSRGINRTTAQGVTQGPETDLRPDCQTRGQRQPTPPAETRAPTQRESPQWVAQDLPDHLPVIHLPIQPVTPEQRCQPPSQVRLCTP